MMGHKSKPWIADSWDGGENVWVWPKDDLIAHEVQNEDCVCKPTCEPVFREDGSNGWLYTHSALDGRDQEVEQEGKPSGRAYIQARWVAGAFAVLIGAQAAVEWWRRR